MFKANGNKTLHSLNSSIHDINVAETCINWRLKISPELKHAMFLELTDVQNFATNREL